MNKPSNSINIKHNPFWEIKKSHILVFLFCFLIITVLTIIGLTKGIDNAISDFFRKIFRNEQIDISIIIITTSSDTINLTIIGFILTGIKKTRQFGMILLISIVTITIVVTYAKPFFAVEQPPYVFNPLVTLPDKFTLEKDSFMPFAQNYSYPSNHLASTTAFSFIIGGLIYRRYPYFAKGFMVFFPTAIGITKLYLLQQYFTDLLGGFFLGLILSSLIIKILRAEPRVKSEH